MSFAGRFLAHADQFGEPGLGSTCLLGGYSIHQLPRLSKLGRPGTPQNPGKPGLDAETRMNLAMPFVLLIFGAQNLTDLQLLGFAKKQTPKV